MLVNRYSVNQKSINSLLVDIKSNQIAIPEIQRPFVWNEDSGVRLHKFTKYNWE